VKRVTEGELHRGDIPAPPVRFTDGELFHRGLNTHRKN